MKAIAKYKLIGSLKYYYRGKLKGAARKKLDALVKALEQ